MMNAAQAAHDLVDHLSIQPRGVVKVSVPVDIAQNQLPKILPAFLKISRNSFTTYCKQPSR